MAVIIPIFSSASPRFDMTIELDNVSYHLFFSWNDREEAWYMDIKDNQDILIQSGIKLSIGYQLITQYKANPLLPLGDFFVIDTSPNEVEAGISYEGLGSRYQLIYYTYEEILNGV